MQSRPRKFDADFSDVLLSEERQLEGSAQSVIRFSGIKKGDTAIDFGCGPGFLAIPLAKKVRKVYAVDINERMLITTAEGAKRQGVKNLEIVKSREYAVFVPEKVDYIFVLSVVHEVVRKRKLFSVFHGLLRKGGKLVVVDWRADAKNWDFGPSERERIGSKDMEEMASGLFKRVKKKLMDNQYYLLFNKMD